ncbi:terminase [Flavobacterium rhizosphaerae]|uniref:Terminase n=1 Tax=Flavobacterium rhizosphaerae TaxID=3163298 RepID=A0ABW8Z038_9FLAO
MKAVTAASTTTQHKNSLYNPEYADTARKMCLLGATDRNLAQLFGVTRETIVNWKRKYPDFKAAMFRGKKAADLEVAHSLYQASLDRIITVKQAIKCKEIYYDENGKRVEKERVEIVEVEKHIPADFRSQQFWLRNRNPEQWNEKCDDSAETHQPVSLNLGFGQNPEEYETTP